MERDRRECVVVDERRRGNARRQLGFTGAGIIAAKKDRIRAREGAASPLFSDQCRT
jgi:hypothetical protein